jgi:hypothetical protein
MIRYSLTCDRRHSFDSWFQDSSAYDRQAKRGLVACPSCGSVKVEKAIMAPQVSDSKQQKRAKIGKAMAASKSAAKQSAAAPSESVSVVSPQERELRTKLKELRDHMTKNADHVGTKFPEEARKMHYGETEHRSIYGEASPEQAKELVEEGIEVYPMPVLPDDQN